METDLLCKFKHRKTIVSLLRYGKLDKSIANDRDMLVADAKEKAQFSLVRELSKGSFRNESLCLVNKIVWCINLARGIKIKAWHQIPSTIKSSCCS